MPELQLLGPELTQVLRRGERRVAGVARTLRNRMGPRVTVDDLTLSSTVGYRLQARVWSSSDATARPAVVLLAGGQSDIAAAESVSAPVTAAELVRHGWVVMALDLAGRGSSLGEDDHGGPEHADNIVCAVAALAARSDVDADRVGLVGLGRGGPIAIAGAAAGARTGWVLDWEGPVDRETLLSVAPDAALGVDDATWWSDRNTLSQLAELTCGYVRLQSEDDHLNPEELRHAQRALFALDHSKRPSSAWFQINDHPRGEAPARPQWLSGGQVVARRTLLRKLARLSTERRTP